MTESSGFWNGDTVGDALLGTGVYAAPYDAETEFNRAFGRVLASDGVGYVIPLLLNDLRVQASSPAAATVDILTGGAYVKGFHYLSDSNVTVAISANASGNPRLDRIVLRVSWASKTVRLAVLAGTPAGTPTLPALTQIYGTTWEIALAYVWVANGFATITSGDIHDERVFIRTAAAIAAADLSGENLILNSEFMAYSDLVTAPPTVAPEGWDIVSAIPTIVSATKPAVMPRGRYLQMTAGGAGRGISQTFNVPSSTMIAIKGVMNVTAGDVGQITITTNSGAPVTITRFIRRTGIDLEETIYYLTEADATTMTVRVTCVNNTDIVKVGQFLAVVGYWPGRFRAIHETIMLLNIIGDTNWLLDAKSTGLTTITLTADFGAFVLPGTRAVCLVILARDSGSAAGTPVISAKSILGAGSAFTGPSCDVQGLPNDKFHSIQGWVALNTALQFILEVSASGALTLDTTVTIVGIQT